MGHFIIIFYLLCLMFPLYCQLRMLACGEREAMVMAPPPMHDSAVSPCFQGCLTFLHRHFPPQSPPSHPLDLSLCSHQQPCPRIFPQSLNSHFQPLHLPGDLGACQGYVWLWQGLYLGYHRSDVSLSVLIVSPLTQTIALIWGSDPLLQVPPPTEGRSSPTNTPFLPP